MPNTLFINPAENYSKQSTEDRLDREYVKLLDNIATMTPRSLFIVSRSRSQAISRRVTPTPSSDSTAVSVVERHLPNGDLYIGTLYNRTPHGSGKYLWKDGCMYEGEWKKGKANGKGKFSWPSGATFEGEFKAGRIEGLGTFSGADGGTCKGSWSGDRKHGYGVKHYKNGDYYEGQWKKNLQDGQGRYRWKNGNEYVGEWKNGVIHGKGVLVWNNGNKYDGEWENGAPKGHGVFSWPRGTCYIGCWSSSSSENADRSEISGERISCPDHHPRIEDCNEEDLKQYSSHRLSAPAMVIEECVDLVTVGSGRKNRWSIDAGAVDRAFEKICIWESEGEAGDITCDIIDNLEASMLYKDGLRQFQRNPFFFLGEVKKPGQMIYKGHKNYDLMLNLQLGIRYSAGKHASICRDLKLSDFDPKEKVWTRFPSEGSKITPPHRSMEFKWKDYNPVVFRHLRELFRVDTADYMLAICGNDALRALSSPGKSGCSFYMTQDDRFMIKTVKKAEAKVLVRMLPSYYQHVHRYKNSLMTKFYGIHCVKPVGGVKTRFIVMGNMLSSEYRIHRKFDLKGSSYGRTTDKPDCEIDETTTLKDLDLDFKFRLQTHWYQELIKQINRDCEFLEGERIMDYSLLVGVHFRDGSTGDEIGRSSFTLGTGKDNSFQNEKFGRSISFLEAELQDMNRIFAGREPQIRLGANLPAQAERIARRSDFDQCSPGGYTGEVYEVVLYFGIIDILQDYDISKKLEHAYKSLQVDPNSISAVDPKLYSKRFRDFVGRTFVEDR